MFCLIFAVSPAKDQNRYLTDLLVQPALVNAALGRSAVISWQTHIAGSLELFICDMDGVVVRRLLDQERKTAGTHSARWDGRDDQGRAVPNGAYFTFLRLTTDRQSSEIHEPARGRWGNRLPVQPVFDTERQQITYTLEHPALCLLRIGIKEGGPGYGTLLHWEPREAGEHFEPWDGKDAQGQAVVYNREKFAFVFDALALPANTLLVQGSTARFAKPEPGAQRIAVHPPTGKGLFVHSLHPRHLCRDPELDVTILQGLQINQNNAPVTTSPLLRFAVNAAHPDQAANMLTEGCEVYAFIDGLFQKEIKADKLPAPIDLPVRTLRPGAHIITFNLRSREDHVGSFSIKIIK
jgi:hypothetical protein